MRHIFVGSAKESKRVAEQIATHLDEQGYKARRWWADEFPTGTKTLDRLREIVDEVDGAVFVFSADDRTWYRGDSKKAPRDNVLVEWGIFASKLGPDRVLIAADRSVKLPSDLLGLSYAPLFRRNITATTEKLSNAFARIFKTLPSPSERVLLDVDRRVIEDVAHEKLPPRWVSRSLYFGTDGGRGWLAQSSDPAYAEAVRPLIYQRNLSTLLQEINVHTFISLGPGDGRLDRELAIKLRDRDPALAYIPVDLSDLLLERAISLLADVVRVPIGILSDFEEQLDWICTRIEKYSRPPRLYALLGYTFGNLDEKEEKFLLTLKHHLGPTDFLLIDISVQGKGWRPENDPRARPQSREASHKRFLATGICRRTGEALGAVLETFDDKVRCEWVQRSSAPGAHTMRFLYGPTNDTVTTITRYHWNSMAEWLSRDIGLKIQDEFLVKENDIVSYGAFLLKNTHEHSARRRVRRKTV